MTHKQQVCKKSWGDLHEVSSLHSTYHHCRRHSCPPSCHSICAHSNLVSSPPVSCPDYFTEGVEMVLRFSESVSRLIVSAGLGSASYVIPFRVPSHDSDEYSRSFGQGVVLSLTHHDHLCLELFSSSPCTTTQSPRTSASISLCRCQNTHGDALPCFNLKSVIVLVTSDFQSCAAAFVPYIDFTSFPHPFSSPGSVLSSSHKSTYVTGCSYVHVHLTCVVEHQHL